MSRIDELLARLAPDGVPFVPLGDVAAIRNGRDYKHLDPGSVPVYGSGGIIATTSGSVHEGPSVLIPRKGSLGNLFFVDVPFWTVDTIFYTEIATDRLAPKFLYYYLLTLRLERMNQAGGVPSQTQSGLYGLRIPLPPREVQAEIVRILDSFQELEAELEARRTQYAHYRDTLISQSGAPTLPLGELGTFTRGRRFTKADYDEVGIPSIHYGEIYTEYGVATTEVRSRVREDLRTTLRFAASGDLVIAGTGENVAEVAKAVAWLGTGEVAIHDDCFAYRHTLEPRYASYAFQTREFQDQKAQFVSESKVVRISSTNLARIEIPVPPIEEQRRIASILDSFDGLVNDLSSGLPAEIAARRQQYEHYRDRLLTFEALSS